jgi:hypothetical protein
LLGSIQHISKRKRLASYCKDMNCPYCGKPATYGPNELWYGRRYGKSYMCYFCKPCDAYVGTHQNTTKPLGTMANRELRQWRIRAHAVIDALWKEKGWSRKGVYRYLRKVFGQEIHIGESDIDTCKKILTLPL